MIKWMRLAVLSLLFILIAMALNISNGAINQMTGENRQAIIGIDYKHSDMCFHFMGKSYVYDQDRLQEALDQIEKRNRQMAEYMTQYFTRYMRIFRAVFVQ